MSNPYFQFKKFTIWQDRCAMKVGTDGVLLGAWAPSDNAQNILDVGTGTGLIALLLAQRNKEASITAVEIDTEAASQAEENVMRSPWNDRIQVICENFRSFESDTTFDLITCNPPYFTNALKCPDIKRSMARHALDLNYISLLEHSRELLCEQGLLCIIIPAQQEVEVVDIAWRYGLYPIRLTYVYTIMGKPHRRVLLCFSQHDTPCIKDKLYIKDSTQFFSSEYRQLVGEFYLNM